VSERAELCGNCGAYLKWLAPTAATPFELLPIEDLASMALDVLAAEQGFGRPSLPDLGGPERLPCEGLET
jgi:formate dehydrogenase maturation protein FdhE